ncbi:MAG: hypothetical protein DDT33_01666 [Firmicutes bacterium]|nr:hypothetical protein [Bacillota bacterium]
MKTLIGKWTNEHKDHRYIRESLYLNDDGTWHLHGEGGSATMYGHGDTEYSHAYGKQVLILSDAEANEWMAKRCPLPK